MKTLRLYGIALLFILSLNACSDLFGGSDLSGLSIRPARVDLDGVTGFVVVENPQATETKSETYKSAPQVLYSIDENGDVKLSIFYFETDDYNGNDNANTTKVLKEISNALQVIPSLVTDLGKYILFSGCQFQIIDPDISDDAKNICDNFINMNGGGNDATYLIRKSDGALFNLTAQYFFSYYDNNASSYYPDCFPGTYIPQHTFCTSVMNNLFVAGCKPTAIFKVEDNGDAVDFRQMTQDFDNSPYMRFGIDKEENIYICNYMGDIQIYFAAGGFDIYKFDIPGISDIALLNLITDETGNPYIFHTSNTDNGVAAICSRLTEGKVECLKTDTFATGFNHDGKGMSAVYLGHYGDSYNWCDFNNILSYDKKANGWSLNKLSADLLHILSSNHDAIAYGSKTYCADVQGNSIEVIEVDIVSETYRTYSFNVDIPSMVSSTVTYSADITQGIPYLTIRGISTLNGAGVSFTIDLIDGVNNSTFAPDGRNVVSFFRIN